MAIVEGSNLDFFLNKISGVGQHTQDKVLRTRLQVQRPVYGIPQGSKFASIGPAKKKKKKASVNS